MEFYFVALILNNVMVQKELKMDSRFKRKMHFMVANQLNLHPLNRPCHDGKKNWVCLGRMGASVHLLDPHHLSQIRI